MKKILSQYVVYALATALMVPLAQAQSAEIQTAFKLGSPPVPIQLAIAVVGLK